MRRLSAILLLLGPLLLPAISFGQADLPYTRQVVVASGVTTNTSVLATTTIKSGAKSFYGVVTCASGTCAQIQQIFGNVAANTTTGILLCTITLSGPAPQAQDACPVVTAAYSFYYVTTSATGGGGTPTGAVYVMY